MKRMFALICLSLIFVLLVGSFASASLLSFKLKPWVSEKLGIDKPTVQDKTITGNVIDDSSKAESISSYGYDGYSSSDGYTGSDGGYGSGSGSSYPGSYGPSSYLADPSSSAAAPGSAADSAPNSNPYADSVDASYLNLCYNQVGKKGSAYVFGEFKDESCEACMKDGSWKYACKSNQACEIGIYGKGKCVAKSKFQSITPDGKFMGVKTPIPSQSKPVSPRADYYDASYLNDIPGAINTNYDVPEEQPSTFGNIWNQFKSLFGY